MNTLITTYYNNPDRLLEFIHYNFKPELFEELIVVDDGSMEFPALDVLENLVEEEVRENIRLYRVTEDLGFNSHGARNLGVIQARTEWVTLIDVDHILKQKALDALPSLLEGDNFIEFNGNQFCVQKKKFLLAGGYNEQLINYHCGDFIFAERLEQITTWINLIWDGYVYNRGAKQLIYDPTKTLTEYPNENSILVPHSYEEQQQKLADIRDQYLEPDTWLTNPLLTFEWEHQYVR